MKVVCKYQKQSDTNKVKHESILNLLVSCVTLHRYCVRKVEYYLGSLQRILPKALV